VASSSGIINLQFFSNIIVVIFMCRGFPFFAIPRDWESIDTYMYFVESLSTPPARLSYRTHAWSQSLKPRKFTATSDHLMPIDAPSLHRRYILHASPMQSISLLPLFPQSYPPSLLPTQHIRRITSHPNPIISHPITFHPIFSHPISSTHDSTPLQAVPAYLSASAHTQLERCAHHRRSPFSPSRRGIGARLALPRRRRVCGALPSRSAWIGGVWERGG
jgi:hypothetical protein